eukprot:gene33423-41240_t
MRGVIRLNDPTSHGGMVVSAAPKTKVMGIAVASKGDYCTCPIPGHGSPLMATAPAAAPSSSPPWTISPPIAKARYCCSEQYSCLRPIKIRAPVESDLLDFLVQTKDLITTNRPLRLRLDCSTQLSDDMLLPQRVYGTESICGSLEYRILCVSTRAQLPLKEFIGLPAALDFVTDRGELRSVCGMITEIAAGDSDGGLASYQLVLRDALSIMDKRINTRVFRNKDEVEIVQLILDEWRLGNRVLAICFKHELADFFDTISYPKREFTMQHNESDGAFIRRLLKR